MYCIKCGAMVNAGDYSCSKCGLILNNSPMERLKMMMEQDKGLKQKMDEYNVNNVIEANKEEIQTSAPTMASPVNEFIGKSNPLNTKEATMVTDLNNSTILNPDNRKEDLWDTLD